MLSLLLLLSEAAADAEPNLWGAPGPRPMCQKRPTYVSKEACLYAKRGLPSGPPWPWLSGRGLTHSCGRYWRGARTGAGGKDRGGILTSRDLTCGQSSGGWAAPARRSKRTRNSQPSAQRPRQGSITQHLPSAIIRSCVACRICNHVPLRVYTYMHTYVHSYIHTYIYVNTHTYTHTHIHTHTHNTHTHTHTHTLRIMDQVPVVREH